MWHYRRFGHLSGNPINAHFSILEMDYKRVVRGVKEGPQDTTTGKGKRRDLSIRREIVDGAEACFGGDERHRTRIVSASQVNTSSRSKVLELMSRCDGISYTCALVNATCFENTI